MTGITCLAYIYLNKLIETDINIFIYDKLVLMPYQFIINVSIIYKLMLLTNSLEKTKGKRE